MKLAIPTVGRTTEAKVEARVGRSPIFAIFDSATEEIDYIDNQSANNVGGAGVATAQFLVRAGVQEVAGTNFGPKLLSVLKQSGVMTRLITSTITVQEVIDQWKAGKLGETSVPNRA